MSLRQQEIAELESRIITISRETRAIGLNPAYTAAIEEGDFEIMQLQSQLACLMDDEEADAPLQDPESRLQFQSLDSLQQNHTSLDALDEDLLALAEGRDDEDEPRIRYRSESDDWSDDELPDLVEADDELPELAEDDTDDEAQSQEREFQAQLRVLEERQFEDRVREAERRQQRDNASASNDFWPSQTDLVVPRRTLTAADYAVDYSSDDETETIEPAQPQQGPQPGDPGYSFTADMAEWASANLHTEVGRGLHLCFQDNERWALCGLRDVPVPLPPGSTRRRRRRRNGFNPYAR